MAKQKKVTRFSVGKFTDGLCVVRGVIVEGVVCGVVVKTMYPDIYEKGTYVELSEFYNINDSFIRFIKVRNFINYFFTIKKENVITEKLFDFIGEISDLPNCAWNYKHIINNGKRTVITEKYLKKNIVLNYKKMTPELELELVQLVCDKYNYDNFKAINCFYVSQHPMQYEGDVYSYTCPIKINSIHNKNLFLDLNTFQLLSGFYQLLVNTLNASKNSLFEEENK